MRKPAKKKKKKEEIYLDFGDYRGIFIEKRSTE